MIAAVGRDPQAEEALAGLRAAGVGLVLQESEAPTGVALIQVDAEGETTIAVAPGANATLGAVDLPPHDAVLCQLEIPDDAVLAAWEECTGLFCLNAAPARPIAVDADLAVVEPARARDARPQGRPRRADTGCRGRRPPGRRRGDRTRRAAARRRGGRDGGGRRVHRVPARVAARGALARGSAPSRVRGRRPRGVALRSAAVAADRWPKSTRSSLGDNRSDADADHPRLRSRSRRRHRAAARARQPRARAARRHDDLREPDAREDDGERPPRARARRSRRRPRRVRCLGAARAGARGRGARPRRERPRRPGAAAAEPRAGLRRRSRVDGRGGRETRRDRSRSSRPAR